MIGRMRPFYQAHWDISKDIKHVWLLICTYYIAWIFQWILGDEGRGKWWDRQYRVWIPQCAAPLDVTVTYARDSFVDSPSGAFCLLEGGPRYPGCYCYICKRQFLWIHPVCCVLSRGGPDTLAPVLQGYTEKNVNWVSKRQSGQSVRINMQFQLISEAAFIITGDFNNANFRKIASK